MERALKVAIACPVCDESTFDLLYEPWVENSDPATLYGAASGVQGTQSLVRCSCCSLVYENPRYPNDVIVRAYVQSEEPGHDAQHAMRVRSFYRALQRLERKLPRENARVLDVGTAGGAFLEAAERFGYEACGLEPSKFLVDQGRKRGLWIEHGTIDEHSFEYESFDMVTLWDVLEHLPNPKSALIEISQLLKPDGTLLINYPDIGTWQARLAGRRFWWILSVHLQHFTRETLTELCSRAGFRIDHFRRYWQTLEFGYLERMAIHYGLPMSEPIEKLTPNFVKRVPIPYYASQRTALARLRA